jgi:hypothetical protein
MKRRANYRRTDGAGEDARATAGLEIGATFTQKYADSV